MVTYDAEREAHRLSGDDLVELVIRTHVPSKWRIVDLETGDVWRSDPKSKFTRLIRATDLDWSHVEMER